MKYSVKTIRELGFEAKWTRNSKGAPIILARRPGKSTWWAVDQKMWAKAHEVGFSRAFDLHTLVGDIFSVPA